MSSFTVAGDTFISHNDGISIRLVTAATLPNKDDPRTPPSKNPMTSRHLIQTLQSLGYSSGSSFPEIPLSCIPLISVLVDDLLHSRAKVTKLEKEVDEVNEKYRGLRIRLGSMETMARKTGEDNERLRGRLKDAEWKDEKIVELEYLVDGYKDRLGEKKGTKDSGFDYNEDNAVTRVKTLEKAVDSRDTEIRHLEKILQHHLSTATLDNPHSRIIYLEEYIRTLESMLSDKSAAREDFASGTVYESMTAELLTYKRQRDQVREKALKYKRMWRQVCEELMVQSEKFELLAEEFRRIMGVKERPLKIQSGGEKAAD